MPTNLKLQNGAKSILKDILYKKVPKELIFHCDKDNVVPHCQSELFFAALQKAGVPSQFYLIPGGNHGPGVHVDKNIQMMVDFFVKNAKKKQTI